MTDSEMIKSIYDEMKSISEDMQTVKRNISDIYLTLENDTNKKIQIIAEGHLDLSRKLDDALKIDQEKELLLPRVANLENEVRRLRDRVEAMAAS